MIRAGLVIVVVALATPSLSASAQAQSIVETGVAPPPEGRPPVAPLRRLSSRRWEIALQLHLPAIAKPDDSAEALLIPVTLLDTWSIVDPQSFRAQALVDMAPFPPAKEGLTVAQNRAGDSRAVIPLATKIEERVQAELVWTVESWSCELDEPAAATIPWPAAWPAEVERWRTPSQGIESAIPEIVQPVERLRASLPADIAPVYAAKEVIRIATRALRNADHEEGGMTGVLKRGIFVWGAGRALASQVGGPADLTCLCLAYLRAAGFPARPTIGLSRSGHSGQPNASHELSMWGEVFLPDIGWVPFDPQEIRGGISPQTQVTRPWKGFGTDHDFKDRVPITHELMIYSPSAADAGRTASYAALCRLQTRLDQPGQGPTDILVKTTLLNRGRGGN